MSPQIILASNNSGKVSEISNMLQDTVYQIVPQSDFGISDAIEDKPTFIENALIKARHASQLSGMPAIADDSGLVVDVLDGEPGVRSARYAGENSNDRQNIEKLLTTLNGVESENRTCRFHCVMVFLRHAQDASPIVADGTLEGIVHHRSQGAYGFGYDPVVWIPDKNCTLAEMKPNEKNKISHRGQALRSLMINLIEELNQNVQ